MTTLSNIPPKELTLYLASIILLICALIRFWVERKRRREWDWSSTQSSDRVDGLDWKRLKRHESDTRKF